MFNDFDKDEHKLKALKISLAIAGGLALMFLLFKSTFFEFVGANDGYYRQAYGEYGQGYVDALRADRKAFFTQDTLRTLILVLLSAGTIFMFIKKKISETVVVGLFAILILFDLVGVDRRYVNTDNFVSAFKVDKPYQANAADKEILQDKDYFRVLDISNEGSRAPARAAYFHNSLSGYHAAKLKRFDELFDFHIAKNNMNVLNMLNTKYFIAEEQGQVFPYVNEDANGNAWFVSRLRRVGSANEAIKALDSLNTSKDAIYEDVIRTTDGSFSIGKGLGLPSSYQVDSTAIITLTTHQPNKLVYKSSNTNDGFAVFSEMYYGNGWQATIDGEDTPIQRVNYTLRGLQIPAGNHDIEFKFEPQVVQTGSMIALGSSVLFGLLLIGGVWFKFRKETE